MIATERRGVCALELTGEKASGPVYLKFHSPSHSIWFGDAEGYTFDSIGRPFAVFLRERRYRRALDGRVVETWWEPAARGERIRRVRVLPATEARDLLALGRSRIAALAAAIHAGRYRFLEVSHPHRRQPDPEELQQFLQQILSWDEQRLDADIQVFRSIYRPVSILPPDQYLALYVQATVGCYYNRCTFCDFYRDRPYYELNDSEFQRHLEAVEAYFGDALEMRKSLFLGDANALYMPVERLRKRFRILNQRYAIGGKESDGRPRFDGVFSFIDAFTGSHLPAEVLRDLARLGLRRVYIGFETGHEPLRRLLQKPGKTAQVVQAVRNVKGAGIAVGLIFLIGVGGEKFAAAHRRDSVAALAQLSLGRDDLIYLSDLVVHENSDYRRVAESEGWRILSAEELHAERRKWMDAIRRLPGLRRLRIANYDIREFVY